MNWLTHFQNHTDIDLESFKDEKISELERVQIGNSIAQFQRGESSEARDFLKKSKSYSVESGDLTFFEESNLFVKEENRHSDLLRLFMTQMQIELVNQSWTDAVFRWIRSQGEIAWSSRVLLLAEIIAQVYYPSLKNVTSSKMLKAICDQIIEDEDIHISFQTERIAQILKQHTKLYQVTHALFGAILFYGTIIVVWFEHRKVFSKSFSFLQFTQTCLKRYSYAIKLINTGLKSRDKNLHVVSEI